MEQVGAHDRVEPGRLRPDGLVERASGIVALVRTDTGESVTAPRLHLVAGNPNSPQALSLELPGPFPVGGSRGLLFIAFRPFMVCYAPLLLSR